MEKTKKIFHFCFSLVAILYIVFLLTISILLIAEKILISRTMFLIIMLPCFVFLLQAIICVVLLIIKRRH